MEQQQEPNGRERPAAINTLHSGVTLSSVSTSASNDSTTDTAPPIMQVSCRSHSPRPQRERLAVLGRLASPLVRP